MSDMDPTRYEPAKTSYAEMKSTEDGQWVLHSDVEPIIEEVKRLRAEIESLRTQALNWVTVTDDPGTLPEEYRTVILHRSAYACEIAYALDGGGEIWWRITQEEGTKGDVPVEDGDRWTYLPPIPEMK